MKKFRNIIVIGLSAVLFSLLAFADGGEIIRWTYQEDSDASIAHIISVLNQKLNLNLSEKNFALEEDRDLAFNHYKRLVQVVNNLPVHGKSIRMWTDLRSRKLIQVEASVSAPTTFSRAMDLIESYGKSPKELQTELSSAETSRMARQKVATHAQDPFIRTITWKDEWNRGQLIREVKVKSKRGIHLLRISLLKKQILSHEYREFPQADTGSDDEFSISAQVYPVYEEFDGKRLSRIPVQLTHISRQIQRVDRDILAPLKTQRYFTTQYDPVLGETEGGRAQGYWTVPYIKKQAALIRESLPLTSNDWSSGVLLQGQYATINIHPDALTAFGPLNFTPHQTSAFFPNWLDEVQDGKPVQEMVPSLAFSGKPLYSPDEALNRPATRLPNHNPTQYMNDGFDEIQVYYAINTLFEELRARGFVDPELSARPFNAILFNPDIASRDNAFYTDDTINFTTYSSNQMNYARDNSTIWHELGHGVMDRLMGDTIELADTGGLSEGMADFVAAMVLQAVTHGSTFPGSDKFRIINRTGFFLTNEVHDDGEAYGGTMKDFMDSVIAAKGELGLAQVADVVMEAMRLTRDYPGLTAAEWFKHILFADSLGRPGLRKPGELSSALMAAIEGRNFKLNGGEVASFSVVNAANQQEITAGSSGSRSAPILLNLKKDESANFQLSVHLKSSEEYRFHYPLQVKVQFNGGPLQGAIHWLDKEKGTQTFTLNSESDSLTIPLQASGKCDEVNRSDGSCVDYAYLQVWDPTVTQYPVAKKRFYLQVKNPTE